MTFPSRDTAHAIPLFPLPLVFFPGSRLPLRIFEPRYLEMVKRCMREESGFGIVLILEGVEALERPDSRAPLPTVADEGTLGHVIDFNALDGGLLGITVEGSKRFRVESQWERDDRLMMADVSFIEEEEGALPPDKAYLAQLATELAKHPAYGHHDFHTETAAQVGWGLAEMLPISNTDRQHLLTLPNASARLEEIERLLTVLEEKHGE